MTIFWRLIGTALLIWVAWDIYAGYTLIREIIYRDDDPVMYWTTVSVWAILGVSCFFSWPRKSED